MIIQRTLLIFLFVTFSCLGPSQSPADQPVDCELPIQQIDENIYVSGQPSARQLRCLREQGFSTVINSRTTAEIQRLNFSESEVAESLGLDYHEAQIGATSSFSGQQLSNLTRVLERSEGKILLHCRSGRRSKGLLAALKSHQQGVSVADAIEQVDSNLDEAWVEGLIEK